MPSRQSTPRLSRRAMPSGPASAPREAPSQATANYAPRHTGAASSLATTMSAAVRIVTTYETFLRLRIDTLDVIRPHVARFR